MPKDRKKFTQADVDYLQTKVLASHELLSNVLQKVKSDNSEDAVRWREMVKSLRGICTMPEILIGVVGATGVGKSKCINALLGKNLMPVSDSRACTAAPVEISHSNGNDSAAPFRASVEFISELEWEAEVVKLISELHNDQGQIDWDAIQSDPSHESYNLVKCAWDTVQAIDPQIADDQAQEIRKEKLLSSEVRRLLGRTVVVEACDEEEFHERLDPYISGQSLDGSDSIMQLWPLVRKVSVFDDAEILSEGIRFVDLPGVQDNNAARSAVASRYLEECTNVLIMAPIVRAQSDQVAMNFLRTFTGMQLQLNDTLDQVVFVCTKTDESLSSIARIRGVLSEKLRPFRAQEEDLRKDKAKLGQQLQVINSRMIALDTALPGEKRKDCDQAIVPQGKVARTGPDFHHPAHKDIEQCTDDLENLDMPQLEAARRTREVGITNIKTQIQQTISQIKQVHIQHRNSISRDAIEKEFSVILDQKELSSRPVGGVHTPSMVDVFCVCSEAYIQLQSEDEAQVEEAVSRGFIDVSDTEIPALQDHCRQLAIDLRAKSLVKFIEVLCKDIISLKVWATRGLLAGSIDDDDLRERRSRLIEFLSTFNKHLQITVNKALHDIESVLKPRLLRNLHKAKSAAIPESKRVCAKWSSTHSCTLKAIARRGGEFTNGKGYHYDLNHQLSESFITSLTSKSADVFDTEFPKHFDDAANQCVKQVEHFVSSAEEQLEKMGAHQQSLKLLQAQSNANAIMIRRHFHDAEQSLHSMQKAYKDVIPIVKKRMVSAYREAAKTVGSGMRGRMCHILYQHVRKRADSMFGESLKDLHNKSLAILENTKKDLLHKMDVLATARNADYFACLSPESEELRKNQIKHGIVLAPMIDEFVVDHFQPVISLLREHEYAKDSCHDDLLSACKR